MMTELVCSKINPVRIDKVNDFFDQFGLFAKNAEEIRITTGFISLNSVLFLKKNIGQGLLPNTIP